VRTPLAPDLLAGYGQADLAAPLGGSMPGYFVDRKATSFLDPLMAKAVYLERGQTQGALVVLDLVGLGAPEVRACRQAVERACGIDPAHVWVHATHTHTGTMTPRSFTSDAQEIHAEIYVGEVNNDWVAELPGRVAQAVRKAQSAAKAGPVQLAQTRVEKIAFYRRFRMKDGKVVTNAGRGNPDIVKPAGTPDPTLTVLRFPESRTLVAIFGVHPDVIGGTLYSADYPAYLTSTVKERLGNNWNVLFMNAACGNINHIDIYNPSQKKGIAESMRIGGVLGNATVAALKDALPLSVDALGFESRVVPSPLRKVPADDLREAERILKEEPAKARSFNGLFAPAAVILGRTKDREQPAEIAAMRLGPVGLVGMPGEIFVELAREVQHESPFDPTRVIGLTNGALGYIPTAAAYEEGGYESGYRSARFEPQNGHIWAQTAIRLLKGLA
jgi:hypothetical protein